MRHSPSMRRSSIGTPKPGRSRKPARISHTFPHARPNARGLSGSLPGSSPEVAKDGSHSNRPWNGRTLLEALKEQQLTTVIVRLSFNSSYCSTSQTSPRLFQVRSLSISGGCETFSIQAETTLTFINFLRKSPQSPWLPSSVFHFSDNRHLVVLPLSYRAARSPPKLVRLAAISSPTANLKYQRTWKR